MHNTTIIIPIHNIGNDDLEFIKRGIVGNEYDGINSQTDKNFKLLFIVSDEVQEEYTSQLVEMVDSEIETKVVINPNETDYQSQINYAVNNCVDTPYFSVVQYDDIILKNYIKNVNTHIQSHEKDIYLPIVFELDDNQNFIGFSNESTWAINQMETFGHFDIKSAKKHNFMNYNLCGATIKSEVFIEAGGFKKSMEKYHDYEFLLRVLEMGKVAYVIPKLTYKHVNGRKGSIHDSQKDMSEDERRFWYNLAKKEYHFDYDREIEYTEA